MPTYDYECRKCSYKFEKFQGIKEAVLKECPKCHSRSLERLIGAGAALLFRGSGFYITDYCRPKQNQKEGISKPACLSENARSQAGKKNNSKKDKT